MGLPDGEKNKLFDIKKIPTGYTRLPALNGVYQDEENEIEIRKAEVTISTRKDTEKFVKLFPDTLPEIIELSKRAQRVINAFILVYINTQKSFKEDTVYFNQKAAEKYADYKRPSHEYFLGLKELKEKKFIYRSEQDQIWFFNPHKFFIGNRLKVGESKNV